MSIEAEGFDSARRAVTDGSHWTLADRQAERGIPQGGAAALARMCTRIVAPGQIGATRRAPVGERRGRWVIGFHRVAAGDFLQLRRPGPAGRWWVAVGPASHERLLTELRTLVTDLPEMISVGQTTRPELH